MEKSINIKELTPSIAIHPGEFLLDELRSRHISQKKFAGMMDMSPTLLNELIKGKRNITADYALLIGKALNMDAIIWMNLQSNYELNKIKIEEKTRAKLEAIDKWNMISHQLPEKYFKKQGILKDNLFENLNKIKSIYNLDNLEQLPTRINSTAQFGLYRKSEKLSTELINLAGWVHLAKYHADKLNISSFNSQSGPELISKLKLIFNQNKNTQKLTTALLAEFGIKLIYLATPEKCAVDGVTFWSAGNPAIAMSLRYKTISNFAFTLLHELGHVYLHLTSDNEAFFIDNLDNKSDDIKESEANLFAQESLINSNDWGQFILDTPHFNEDALISFSRKQNLHPGIILGRYSYQFNRYNLRTSINKTLN